MVTLHDLTPQNWHTCIRLRPRPDQESFIESNLFSIAQCKVESFWVPQAIYANATMVGFVMYGKIAEGTYEIGRIMIDQHFQGRGHAKAAMQLVIERLRALSDCMLIKLSHVPGNSAAAQLYTSLGFSYTGEFWDDEPVLQLIMQPEGSLIA
jgi:diamine N-acetyltransferase